MPPFLLLDNPLDESAHLSNDEVRVLYSIVQRTQERIRDGARIFDALFSAYETVFAENALDPSQDRLCFRVLFRLGQPDGSRAGLYQRFEKLLAEQNIVLEVEDDSLALQDASEAHDLEDLEPGRQSDGGTRRDDRPSRRASFTSLYDVTKDLSRPPPRASSRSSISKIERQGKLSAYEFGNDAFRLDELPYRPRLRATEIHRKQRDRNRRHSDEFHMSDDSDKSVASLGHSDESQAQQLHLPNPNPAYKHYRLSDTQLIDNAALFNETRRKGLLRDSLTQWTGKSRAFQSRNESMERQAARMDALTLVREAFATWRNTTHQIRHQAQTDRFFEHLHVRAGKARDLYLLTKAFSHWRAVTDEEVARTGIARRHLLRVKYFEAWRDITIVNELKAHRHGMKRPFNLLRNRFTQIRADEMNALSVYHYNLTKLVFYRWFWAFCEAAIPRYRESRSQGKVLRSWIDKAKARSQQERQADAFLIRHNVQKVTSKWATAARIDVGGYHQADGFRITRLLGPITRDWQTQAKHAPLARRILNMRDWRIARTFFSTWIVRNRMASRAAAVGDLRMKQNAWTAWNDQLRINALESQIGERLLVGALYRWVLQERGVLMKRVHERRIQRAGFTILVQKFRARNAILTERGQKFEQVSRTSILSSTLECWTLRMNLRKERDQMASEYYSPRIEFESLSAWRAKLDLLPKHELWARDARFYFCALRIMKKWSAAAQEAQKQRRQEAYGTIRRLVKVDLARKALQTWHERLTHVASLQEASQTASDTTLRNQTSGIFSSWKSVVAQRYQDYQQAASIHEDRMLRQNLVLWQDHSRTYLNAGIKAVHFYDVHISQVCTSQLRKLSLRAFEIRCRDQAADATRERHFDKHIRRMFRHWNDRTRGSMLSNLTKEATTLGSSPPGQNRPDRLIAVDRSVSLGRSEFDMRRAEEWTAFDDLLATGINDEWIPPLDEPPIGSSTPAATPGYLNTPSKRAVRARALANLSTTPAGIPPVRTPFAARLRAEGTPGTERERTARKVTFDE